MSHVLYKCQTGTAVQTWISPYKNCIHLGDFVSYINCLCSVESSEEAAGSWILVEATAWWAKWTQIIQTLDTCLIKMLFLVLKLPQMKLMVVNKRTVSLSPVSCGLNYFLLSNMLSNTILNQMFEQLPLLTITMRSKFLVNCLSLLFYLYLQSLRGNLGVFFETISVDYKWSYKWYTEYNLPGAD